MQARKRTGVMQAKPFEERLLRRMSPIVIVQPKLDGARIRAVWNGSSYVLFSSTGLVVNSIPTIQKSLNSIAEDINYITLDGEAYRPDMKLQQIMRIVSKTTSVDQYQWMLSYHIFDIINARDQLNRVLQLFSIKKIFGNTESLELVPHFPAKQDNWQEYLQKFMEMHYEGIIIRDANALYTCGKQSCILKVKPTKLDEYRILGCTQAISIGGEPKGMVGAFNLIDSTGNHFQASAGRLNHDERAMWWNKKDELPGKICVVKYLTLTERGVPREPVTMEIKEA